LKRKKFFGIFIFFEGWKLDFRNQSFYNLAFGLPIEFLPTNVMTKYEKVKLGVAVVIFVLN